MMFLFGKLTLGALMIAITVVIHALVSDVVLRFLDSHIRFYTNNNRKYWKILALIISVFLIGAALMLDIWLWAALFYVVEPEMFKDIETALYFATITFTTVGYGDVVLPPPWRILSGTAAINGMLLFGWSAAFIFEIMAMLYEGGRKHGKLSND